MIDNVTVIESFVFNQARAVGTLRKSNGTCIVERLFVTNEQSVLKSSQNGRVVSDADCDAIGTGLNPGEDMDVCKCFVLSRHGDTLNSRTAVSTLVRFAAGEERTESPGNPQGILSLNWRWGTEHNHTIICIVLKAKANDRRKNIALSRDDETRE
ncbi:hypothetical protein TNCV_3469261 [Trichonephila clavipes]|nr:hypothetical protein TNCV_3469261 [Trichonephila clavipes]